MIHFIQLEPLKHPTTSIPVLKKNHLRILLNICRSLATGILSIYCPSYLYSANFPLRGTTYGYLLFIIHVVVPVVVRALYPPFPSVARSAAFQQSPAVDPSWSSQIFVAKAQKLNLESYFWPQQIQAWPSFISQDMLLITTTGTVCKI
jgi:hypothetical protein